MRLTSTVHAGSGSGWGRTRRRRPVMQDQRVLMLLLRRLRVLLLRRIHVHGVRSIVLAEWHRHGDGLHGQMQMRLMRRRRRRRGVLRQSQAHRELLLRLMLRGHHALLLTVSGRHIGRTRRGCA